MKTIDWDSRPWDRSPLDHIPAAVIGAGGTILNASTEEFVRAHTAEFRDHVQCVLTVLARG